jgi:signal transduction histidine kinase
LHDEIITPKCYFFQESLARLLKIAVGLVTPDGKLAVMHNAMPPYSKLGQSPRLAAAYREFFLQIPEVCGGEGHERIIYDPLGLPVGVLPLHDGSSLILGGFIERRDLERLTELQNRLRSLGLDDDGKLWLEMVLLSLKDLRDKLNHLKALYKQGFRSINENTELGRQALILSAVEEINKLMVSTLNPDLFNLESILDLVASSLVILTDGEGALAFTYCHPRQVITTTRGEGREKMQALAEEWASAAARGANPAASFSGAVGKSGLKLQTETIESESASTVLGVIAPPDKHLRAALAAFGKQVAIALEVSALYEVIQQRFGMLFNSIRQGIVATDSAGKVMLFNQAAGTIFETLGCGLAVGELFSECGFCHQIEKAAASAAATGCFFEQQRAALGPEDNLTHLSWDLKPLLRDDGSVAGTVLVLDDITEPVKHLWEIQDWERLNMAIEVAAGLAHEIRNPLATAKAAIQLYEIIHDEAKRRELMGKLENELDRMNQVLTTFLSLSKPMQDHSLQPINIAETVRELALLLKGEAHMNEIELVVKLPAEELPPVVGSDNGLKQVFMNITRNAFEAMAKGGRLEISLSGSGNGVAVNFQDNGAGIPPENLANITRPFFTTKLGGTGLGLSISSTIVKMMGGEMRIESKPGEGTTVTIILPTACGTVNAAPFS